MSLSTLLSLVSLLAISLTVTATNITDVLSSHPEYSQFNTYLSQTKLADEINTRQTITVLAVSNGALAPLAGKPLSVIKNVLSLHVLLDYFDAKKLHDIPDGSTLSTTLYQTTGNAQNNIGFVNITDLKGGKVGFGSGISGSKLDSSYYKEIKQVPYNFSVIEISTPIIVPSILAAPAPTSDLNITALLEKAGCKTFASLLLSTGVLKVYQSSITSGLTVFAPNDEAFKRKEVPDLSKLTNAELVTLLQYHALSSYRPIGSLKSTKDPISTIATNGAGKFDLSVATAGDSVSLKTGLGDSRIAATVIDSTPFVVYTVDNVLVPKELLGVSPSPAPTPGAAEAPADDTPTPSPAPSAKAPSSVKSPPAPPSDSPNEGPADAPGDDSENSKADKAAAGQIAPGKVGVFVTVSVGVIVAALMS
ncbi:Fasciclin-like arabinogalactan protein 8 [Heracleum sosnowskyi]|uniref:Fasciclin-like arabinogalactan protein 8 n=1 Tax=Heracleum sosnowskyi TaxID=360622 RepID=A0AAD8I1Q9_9APIA|nr:Fasciclin-like arabinogalactan protein 8 [Heracleum sosnowskyi]